MNSFNPFLVLLLSCCLGLGEGAKFLLTVPKEPHYDSNFTATVTGVGVTQKELVTLEYRTAIDRSRLLHSTALTFTSNSMLSWSVMFPWSEMEEYGEDSIVLTMSSLYNQESLTLRFSQQTGYIFIQTDKPLYSPRQTVKFRIIAVNEYQKLAQYPLKVDIMNEKLIVVDRMRYTAEEAFQGQDFELPRETNPGNWTITANFEGQRHAPRTSHSVTFEVKEYVLPRFSADVKVSTAVITKSIRWITITVFAKYVEGKNVDGSVDMQLGIWDPKIGLQLFPKKYFGQLSITNGVLKTDIQVAKLIPRNLFEQGEKRRLYISVNVTERGTQEVDRLEDTSTFIAHPYYDIDHNRSKSHFKPGFPYALVTEVRAKSGQPGSNLLIWNNATFKDKNGTIIQSISNYHHLDAAGMLMNEYDVPKKTEIMTVRTVIIDFSAGQGNTHTQTIPRLMSGSDQYLHISLVRPIKKRTDGLLRLQYTAMEDTGGFRWRFNNDYITVLILSKGHIVYSTDVTRNTDGLNTLNLPVSLYREISPYMRILAYYYHNGTKPQYISDSMKVNTDHTCVEELRVTKEGIGFAASMPKKPQEAYKLNVRGGPEMKVGFVAVDKAVFLLNDRQTLTREKMFDKLATHDMGEGIGDGQGMKQVFENTGLVYMILDTEAENVQGSGSSIRGSRDKFFVRNPPSGRRGQVSGKNIPRKLGVRKGQGPKDLQSPHLDPPQTVRRYFPESWLFENYVLSKRGRLVLNTTLPDSITTWSFMAVGISSTRGVCVSERLEQKVQKVFFVDVRLPFKTTRLEAIDIKVAVYNHHTYEVMAHVVVSGDDGLCFSANQRQGNERNFTTFDVKLAGLQSTSKTIKIIPLRNGDLTIRVDGSNQNERDVVEKKLYVVAEGLRVRKSLTFVLDPEAKHAKFRPNDKNRITLMNTVLVNNMIDINKKTQRTKIDLSMPKEVIRGTEFCRVSAFGDLMGDIINHAVVKSKSLMENGVHDAEEVIGDLGPTVHALLYANKSALMNKQLQLKGRRFIRHGVSRLLKYRVNSAFHLVPGSEESTRLTAIVLKTLCHATPLAYIDKEDLIDMGFYWLLSQIRKNGTLQEKDWRLADDSEDYKIMLSAEVLIALKECNISAGERLVALQKQMASSLNKIDKPMVLAKVAYALLLADRNSVDTIKAISMLHKIRRKNNLGQFYWADRVETNDKKFVPFWYRRGAKSSSIEGTAFALMVYLHSGVSSVDAIADWLVAQRNEHGSFNGAMDSTAAIQALSYYSLQRHFVKVDLSCNVSFDKQKEHSHSFKFTEKNAIRPAMLSDVPVQQTIEVLTKGEGLGQMHVNVEYNIPYDQNENCPFNVTIKVKNTEVNFFPGMFDYPLCMSCNINCPKPPEPEVNETGEINCTLINGTLVDNSTECLELYDSLVNATTMPNTTTTSTTTTTTSTTTTTPRNPVRVLLGSRGTIVINRGPKGTRFTPQTGRVSRRRDSIMRKVSSRRKLSSRRRKNRSRKNRRRRTKTRKPRSVRNHPSASKRSICIHICLEHLANVPAGETRIEIEMLTGYYPVIDDVEAMKNSYMVKTAAYIEDRNVIVAVFKKVANDAKTCIAFRAVDKDEVGRATPASVVITEEEEKDPSCVALYHAPQGQESLQVYCADFHHINRGECRCYSGICSACSPHRQTDVQLHKAKQMVCQAHVGYQVQVTDYQDRDQWLEIEATVLSLNKTGSHQLTPYDNITLITPSSCGCPNYYNKNKEPLYLLSRDVEIMVDRHGKEVHRYLLDENSSFLRVAEQADTVTKVPTYPHFFLQQAFSKYNKC